MLTCLGGAVMSVAKKQTTALTDLFNHLPLTTMIKILANDGIDPVGKKLLEEAGFFIDTNNIPQDELPVKLQNYDGILQYAALRKCAKR